MPVLKLLLSLLCLTIPARGDLQGDSILEKARIEGIVNIAGNQMITNKLVLEAFKKKYPFIKVNVIDFEFINAKYRFYHLFESDSPSERGDVILRAEDKDLEEWIKNGWLAKLSEMPFWAQRPMSEERSPYYAYYVGMKIGRAHV